MQSLSTAACFRDLTCAYKWVKNKVAVFGHGVVGHDERQAGVHAGVPDEMSVLHAVGANQFPLTVCYLRHRYENEITSTPILV